jgi:hypothetical protein
MIARVQRTYLIDAIVVSLPDLWEILCRHIGGETSGALSQKQVGVYGDVLGAHVPDQGVVEDALCNGQNHGAAKVLHEDENGGAFGNPCLGEGCLNRD